jgi:heptosyltransferase-2
VDPQALEDAARARGAGGGEGLVRSVLVRAPNWVGDVALSLGALRDVRRNFPEARLEVLARPWVAGLYAAVPEVDATRESAGTRADALALRGAGHEVAILFPNSFAAAWTAWRAGIRERWGYATDGRGPLLTRRAAVPAAVRGRSQVYYYRAMLGALGLRVSAAPDVSLACPPAWREEGAALLGGGDWIGLNPGAFFGGAKRWLPERFAAVGRMVARRLGARVAIVGGADERPAGEAVAALVGPGSRVLCGETSLPALVGVLAGLRLLVTNDSGPMHLASALGTPLVALFGPTDWRETAPAGKAAARLVREPVHCSPCLLRVCPIDHRCMRRIDAGRVAGEALGLVGAA